MTTTAITFQQANTSDGTYDVRQPMPKPVTFERKEPRRAYIGHPTNQGPDVGNLVGFVADPDSLDLKHIMGLPEDPDVLVGMFPVYSDAAGRFYTDARRVESIVSTTPDNAHDVLTQEKQA